MNIQWDYPEMIQRAGGPTALVKLLEKHGYPTPVVDTVHVWKARKRVPARWVPSVVYVLAKEGVPVTDVMDDTSADSPF